jgi:hypothetical protein
MDWSKILLKNLAFSPAMSEKEFWWNGLKAWIW